MSGVNLSPKPVTQPTGPASSTQSLSGQPAIGQPARKPTSTYKVDTMVIEQAKIGKVPSFSLSHPMAWVEGKAMKLSDPLHVDSKVLVRGIVYSQGAAWTVKLGSVAAEAVKIGRTTGFRAFAVQNGTKGMFKLAGATIGKSMLRAYGVQGTVIVGSLVVGAVVYGANHRKAAKQLIAAGT
ncbi:MAG: hypothetical protein H7338_18260 [Candidatus Sericytochromatia bacterium]|nr:hypothetical protein [Candidatus Sericytochromatia bacterium]